MNKKIQTSITTILLATFFLLSTATGVFAATREDAVDKIRLAFNAAYNAGDAKAMGKILDRDAVWMPPTGEQAIIGADKIVARYTGFFKKIRSAFELQPGTIEICGQWAFVSGPWQREDADKSSGKRMTHGGYYLMVLKKKTDGSWKIARDIWNDVKP